MAIDPLAWDTAHFGYTIGRAHGDAEVVKRVARSRAFQCVYLFEEGAEPQRVQQAVEAGALLVDLRIEMTRGKSRSAQSGRTRPATIDDRASIDPLARALAAESRFTSDPRFAREKVEAMYALWLERCLADGLVVVPRDGLHCFVGATRSEAQAHIELVYAAPEARGTGIATVLVEDALAGLGSDHASVVTQVGNIRAQRLYQSLGFKPHRVTAVLHLWL